MNGIVAQHEKAMGHPRRGLEKPWHKRHGAIQINAAKARATAAAVGVNMKKGARRPIAGLCSLSHCIRADLSADLLMPLIILVCHGLISADEQHDSALPVGSCCSDQKPDPLMREGVGAVEIRSNLIEKISIDFQTDIHCRGPRCAARISSHPNDAATPFHDMACHVFPATVCVVQFCPRLTKGLLRNKRVEYPL